MTTQTTYRTNGNSQEYTRLPPHSEDAEAATLGSLMIDPNELARVASWLTADMFYRQSNKLIYEAMLSLWKDGKDIDFITLVNVLERAENVQMVGGEAKLIELINIVPTSINLEHYAEIVKDMYTRRQLIQAASTAANLAYADGNIEAALDEAQAAFDSVRGGSSGNSIGYPRVYCTEFLDRIEQVRSGGNRLLGLSSGYKTLDAMINGFEAPNMYIIAGRPAMGKSAILVNIADHMTLKQNKKVLLFSLEMSEYQITSRRVSSLLRMDNQRLRRVYQLNDAEMMQVRDAAGRLSESGLFLDTTGGITAAQIKAKATALHREHTLDAIMVDHLHLMRPTRPQNRKDLEVGESSRELTELGKALNVPVIVACQLSRSVESRQNKRPTLSDLRESGAIEENAFCVIMMYRDEYYNPETTERPNIGEAIITKNREGATGTADLYWHGQYTTFTNLKTDTIHL